MPIRKRPELDCDNPPGQIVNDVVQKRIPAKEYKPTHGGFPDADKRTQAEWDRFQKERHEQTTK